MSGIVKSVGGFLGLGNGGEPQAQNANPGSSALNWDAIDTNSTQNQPLFGQVAAGQNLTPDQMQKLPADMQAALASGSMTGTNIAQQALGNNQAYNQTMSQGEQQFGQANSLYGNALGQAQGAEDQISQLEKQGFNLQPQDQSLYGQEAGSIARQFGSQGNDMANNLAARGLSSSGAAGASFSGLQGSQNEMLAQAQQQIAQQRFQNTMDQIGQQQQFASQMLGTAGNANQSGASINQNMGNYAGQQLENQYGRQLAGAQNRTQGLQAAAGQATAANSQANQANMAAYENQPANLFDTVVGGATQGAGAAGKTAGQAGGAQLGTSLFGA